MAYHPLTNETGGTAEERKAEAWRLLKIIGDSRDLLTQTEESFIEDMIAYRDDDKDVSPKQLFWLRDIKDKYL